MTSNTPTSKVTAAGVGGAAGTLIWALLGIFGALPDGADPTLIAAASGATSTILAFAAGYAIRERRGR